MQQTIVFSSPKSMLHNTGTGHPESISRYQAILSALRKNKSIHIKDVCRMEQKMIFLCHSRQYVRAVKRECENVPTQSVTTLSTGDTKICRESYIAAVAAVGTCLQAVDDVMKGECHNAFVVVRPPGHHAERSRGMGFCLFNNVAITARYLQRNHNLRRIAIIDWDAHHGNGTENLLASDNSFFYWSTHERGAYPQTGTTCHDTTFNYPIDVGTSSREELLYSYTHTLQAALNNFQPECILISCGFDAHKNDPLTHLSLETNDFFTLTSAVRNASERLCHGRLVSVLEGGYNLDAIAQSSVQHVEALLTTQ